MTQPTPTPARPPLEAPRAHCPTAPILRGPPPAAPPSLRPPAAPGAHPASLLFSFLIGANLALGLTLTVASLGAPPLEGPVLAGLICACPAALAALGASLVWALRPAATTGAVFLDADAATWSAPTQRLPRA